MSRGLEALKEMRKYGAVMIPNCEIIEKELKALEIIKNKKVDVLSLLCGCNFDDYNRPQEEKGKLTKEEYDLLKEVLNNNGLG